MCAVSTPSHVLDRLIPQLSLKMENQGWRKVRPLILYACVDINGCNSTNSAAHTQEHLHMVQKVTKATSTYGGTYWKSLKEYGYQFLQSRHLQQEEDYA